jgi:DNA polymerase I
MQIKELAENMGYEVLHGIVDCLWVIGEPISVFKEAVERETGILTEVDTYDWITFLPMSDGKDFEYPAFISQHLPNACG